MDRALRTDDALVNPIEREGIWVLLYMHYPGREGTASGVLVWDSLGDKLHLLIRELRPDENDEDVSVFWGELEVFLLSLVDDMGGLETLQFLESGSSHVVQVSARTEARITEPKVLLLSLFDRFVSSVGATVRVTEQELKAAQNQLPVLPSLGVQIIAALNNPHADSRDIERAVSRDPVLALHIVRLANSAAFPLREPARSLGTAIQRIGFDATKLHVFALIIAKIYSAPRLRGIWDHSVKAAQVARQLAKAANIAPNEVALLSLVHDIGRIVMFAVGEAFESAYAKLQTFDLTEVEIENRLCALNHSEIGADLLRTWHFPEDMCEAVRYHHQPSAGMSSLSALLFLAECSLEKNEDTYDPFEHSVALRQLSLNRKSVTVSSTVLDSDLQLLRSAAV